MYKPRMKTDEHGSEQGHKRMNTISRRTPANPRALSPNPRPSASIRGRFLRGLLVGLTLTLTGCTARGPYEPMAAAQRDSIKAQSLTQDAAAIIDTKPEKAERLLRDALTADLYHGPAHNNLGVLYLTQGKLYEAASEFEWARKLMPGHPDPRMNLAMVLEQAGRTDEALAAYAAALEVYPDHIGAIQGLARLQVRAGRTNERTPALLNAIAMRGEDEQWRDWARSQSLRVQSGSPP